MLTKCFGKIIDENNEKIRVLLRNSIVQAEISKYLAKRIGELITEKRKLEFENEEYRLSLTPPFTWRRRHICCEKTIFNYVATYNDYESDFANFLNDCSDISKFAALSEHYTQFKVDYLSSSGALKFYYPDFVAVQTKNESQIFWVIETKGRIFDNVECKEAAMKLWCDNISLIRDEDWRHIRVNQKDMPSKKFKDMNTFDNLLHYITYVNA
jgi:type III restriction enzyme